MTMVLKRGEDVADQVHRPVPLLNVDQLCIDIGARNASVRIVDKVSFTLGKGERVALVGESGSGKSVTAQALMRLNPRVRLSGRVDFDGADLLQLSAGQMAALRGSRIGMVFQDPMSSLDPLMTIGDQVAETLRIRGIGRQEARRRALEVLDELKVERAVERLESYPHEFSGGMRQRVVLAMALVGEPDLLIADEPTTALDVRVQERVLDLLDEISRRRGLAVLLITHDMGIVAGFADRVMVMYSGRIVEENEAAQLFREPQHPYTRGLLEAVPRADRTVDRLPSINGAPPLPSSRPKGCHFHPRCDRATGVCSAETPGETFTPLGGRVRCHLYGAG
ncbi:MAG TPA: ABC transporter ATP-binding protein [Devosia sp.]|jgi:oligopeptide/dipeptide ABC transporter ATP-binding protein|uniref:ABC transporter ATP-binding protein n=1 Tax=Devosia sp. TaxID=1871048 RepID=UPI002DDCF151|nr:ABC transporter ATP-binding protein [Devosia sp.]HEV2517180.1 ABC transporter ATP-binding protein [Devosia sp.]